MKKLLLLLLAILFYSCSSEDESSNQIVGSWQYQGITEFIEEGETIERDPAPCTENSIITFSNNGSFKSVEYTVDVGTGECIINELATSDDLQWEEISNGTFNIFSDENLGTEYEISFPDNKTMWMISGETYTREEVNYSYRAYVYKKI
ncbi:hypothetical protein [Salegentibacter flavus]|uniref:Lipocalin-like domain-containing protein n=1 Tax=Salegentibacter flavus TaxID=287099 RepID=A0A1I4YGV2_9FLAO|nr:hypothetical protein [Salegentibacter flavus]SFN37255.1 hypothetical protein SAMN05660413_00725 [Salegentibacter flavus]